MPLVDLFANNTRAPFAVVSMDWEHLKVCMLILESYVFVGGEVFLGAYGAGVAAMLLKVVGGESVRGANGVRSERHEERRLR